MSKQKLIDARKTVKTLKWYLETNEENGVVYIPDFAIKKIINQPTINTETLPIVKELQDEITKLIEERDCAVKDLRRLENNSLCDICRHCGALDMDLYCASCNGTPYVISDCFEWRGKQQ